MSLAMSRAEREAFLADVHVGVVSIADPGRGPLTAPIWYAYEPGGDVVFVTGRQSRKGKLLHDGIRISFCVQRERSPYAYVVVEGPATLGQPDYQEHVRDVAVRYLGPAGAAAYLGSAEGQADQTDSVLVSLHPERWLTVDYGKMGG